MSDRNLSYFQSIAKRIKAAADTTELSVFFRDTCLKLQRIDIISKIYMSEEVYQP